MKTADFFIILELLGITLWSFFTSCCYSMLKETILPNFTLQFYLINNVGK